LPGTTRPRTRRFHPISSADCAWRRAQRDGPEWGNLAARPHLRRRKYGRRLIRDGGLTVVFVYRIWRPSWSWPTAWSGVGIPRAWQTTWRMPSEPLPMPRSVVIPVSPWCCFDQPCRGWTRSGRANGRRSLRLRKKQGFRESGLPGSCRNTAALRVRPESELGFETRPAN
jgi:hypothetical protein